MPTPTFSKAISTARRKNLSVAKNVMSSGWTITLPNGSVYVAKDNKELIAFIQGY